MSSKAKNDRLEALHRAHLEAVDQLDHIANPLVDKIKKENDPDIRRAGRVLMRCNLDTNASVKRTPSYAYSHEAIDEIRGADKEFRISVFKSNAVAEARFDKFTRDLHSLLDLDTERQNALRDSIGLTAALDDAERISNSHCKVIEQIRAYKPKTASVLRRKVEIILALLNSDHVEADGDLFEILKGDISRLFPASKPKNRRSA
jgi:hypothetical protein